VTPDNPITGSIQLLFLYDVADEIHLEGAAGALNLSADTGRQSMSPPPAHFVRFEKPPFLERLPVLELASGEKLEGCLRYFEYGIVSAVFQLAFSCGWEELVTLSSRWVASAEVERHAAARVQERVSKLGNCLDNPYETRLSEDYTMIVVHPQSRTDGHLPAAELLARYRSQITRIVRAETRPLSDAEASEILEASISYFPDDLLVAGWSAAFIYDEPDEAELTIRLLEYANVQLLEFRHYDEVLSRVLAGTYKALEQKPGALRRWKMAREATALNTLLLDVREITERMDNSVKFLSDMFSARLYRLAASRIGVPDYRKLVEDKLAAASEVYGYMVDQFNHARAFVLESMVVLILIIDLVVLFVRPK
jgi:hypothetical protein